MPGNPETRTVHARWLRRYLPMVEEGTWAWLEINDSSLFSDALPENVVASVFANRELYLALANYGQTAATVQSTIPFSSVTEKDASGTEWNLPPRSLRILKAC